MLLVYSLLQGHPAAVPCEQFLRAHLGWFTSPLVLIETKHILTRVYGVNTTDATNKLLQFAAGPVVLLPLDDTMTLSVLQLADTHGLDLTDAVLLYLTQQCRTGFLATDDQRLAQTSVGQPTWHHAAIPAGCGSAQNNKAFATWENSILPRKGVAA